METYSIDQVVNLIDEYKKAYENIEYISLTCSETLSNFRFVEKIQLCNIDDSFLNTIHKCDFFNSIIVINEDRYPDINTLDELRELNGETYKNKKDNLVITTTISKELFIGRYNLANKYLYSTLEDFLLSVEHKKLTWNFLEYKMNIFLLESNYNFKSNFLNIESLNIVQNQLENESIFKLDAERFIRFNKIYEVYDDKQIKSYFDYPLTWLSNNKSNKESIINYKVISTFIKIICNNDLGKNKYLVRGHKTITLELIESEIPEKVAIQIGELFDFILDDEKHHDKLNILRNTLTIFLDSESNIENFVVKSEEILKSVKYNFNLYIQDKVKLFLEQKNKLLQEFINTTRKIEELTGNLISQIRTVSLSLLGTIFLRLLNNINQGNNRALLNLVILSYTFYLMLNLLIVCKQNNQKEAMLNNLKKYTEELGAIGDNKDNNLSYESLKDKYLQMSLNYYENYRQTVIFGLMLLIIIFIMLYFSIRFNSLPWLLDFVKFVIGY